MKRMGLSAVVTVVVSLLLCQLFLFLTDSYQETLPEYGLMMHYDPQREGGHLIPNLNMCFHGEKRGQKVKVITNKQGFRNEYEFEPQALPGTFRILFLGDSFVDGIRTDQKQTIGYMLEKLLNQEIKNNQNKPYRSVEVMISGHNNSADAWYYYQEHGYKYNPDLVILGVTLGNDITWHNYKGGVLPVKDVDGTIRLSLRPNSKQYEMPLLDLQLPKDAYVKESLFLIIIRKLELRVREFLARISYVFGYSVPPYMGPLALTGSPYHVYAADYCNSLGLFYQPIMPEIEKMFCDFEEVLFNFHRKVETNGSKFLVVLFPIRIQVSQKDWDLLTRLYFLKKSAFDLYYPNRRLNDCCTKKHIMMLDLMREFIESKNKPLYRARGDMHFNEAGQEIAARIIANGVKFIVNQ